MIVGARPTTGSFPSLSTTRKSLTTTRWQAQRTGSGFTSASATDPTLATIIRRRTALFLPIRGEQVFGATEYEPPAETNDSQTYSESVIPNSSWNSRYIRVNWVRRRSSIGSISQPCSYTSLGVPKRPRMTSVTTSRGHTATGAESLE
jgi:hypothetical protein